MSGVMAAWYPKSFKRTQEPSKCSCREIGRTYFLLLDNFHHGPSISGWDKKWFTDLGGVRRVKSAIEDERS